MGSFTITNQNDADTFSCYTAVTGDLNIDAPGLGGIFLPNLTTIGGSFELTGSGDINLGEINLPVLTSVGSNITLPVMGVNEPISLQILLVPALQTVGGWLWIDGSAIATLDFPSLTSVGNGFLIGEGAPDQSLTTLSAPKLTTTGNNVSISASSTAAVNVSMPLVSAIGLLDLQMMPGTMGFDALTSVGGLTVVAAGAGTFTFSALATVSPGALQFDGRGTLSAPNLQTVAGNLSLGSVGAVAGVSLPSLTSTGGLHVVQSTLAAFDLPALKSTGAVLFGYEYKLQCLDGNTQLASLHIPQLTKAGSMEFANNPLLPLTCVQALLAQITPAPQYVIDCTLASGPCP